MRFCFLKDKKKKKGNKKELTSTVLPSQLIVQKEGRGPVLSAENKTP